MLLPLKCNIAPEQTGLAYELRAANRTAVVEWEPGPVTVSVDDALAPGCNHDGERSAVDEATEWLRQALAGGPQLAKDVKHRAAGDGITSRTLDRAKAKLHVMAAPNGYRGPWAWRLPDDAAQRQTAPSAPQCANTELLAHSGNAGALWQKANTNHLTSTGS